jgi:hypothetical protein
MYQFRVLKKWGDRLCWPLRRSFFQRTKVLRYNIITRGFHFLERLLFDRYLKRMRELVRTRQYVMTLHAEGEMEADGLTVYDVESAILIGQIIEQQKDRASAEWKYVGRGKPLLVRG